MEERKIDTLLDAGNHDVVVVRRKNGGGKMVRGPWYEDYVLGYADSEKGTPREGYEFFVEVRD